MPRSKIYNYITTPEKLAKISRVNRSLLQDFLLYLRSIDRSPNTIETYRQDIGVFLVYNLEYNDNKEFTKITKRELIRFQNHALTEWKWSPNRIRGVKSALSSMSSYIENILDEEYPGYRNIVCKIESPAHHTVMEPSVFTEDELKGLLDHLIAENKIRHVALLALAMYSGRRKSELLRFKIDWFTDENVIYDTLWKTPERVQTKGRGSRGKQIYLYVLKNKFEPYLDLWRKYRKEHNIDSEWMFPSYHDYSKSITIDLMNDIAKEFSMISGKDFYWHAMRHFFTTMLIKQNVPMPVIQDIINWESADMLKIYSDLSTDENIGRFFKDNKIS